MGSFVFHKEAILPEILLVSAISTDGGTQTRASLNDETIRDYMLDMLDGALFPPVVVYYDGEIYWLADGFHRLEAAKRANQASIATELRQGTRRDAILYSVSANGTHGLRRTNEDKRRAVEALLHDPEWQQWSDIEISRRCGVSNRFVGNLREELTLNGSKSNILRKGADGRTINTLNIGRSSIAPPMFLSDDHTPHKPYFEHPEYPEELENEYAESEDDDVSSIGRIVPKGEQPSMPSKEYHAANRTVGEQFHSKLVWNYSRINLDFWQCFTIGYSQRTWEQFAELLELAKVSVLMDVRKSAISQYKPEFNKQQLAYSCSAIGIRYIHVPELGVEYEDRAELSETHDYTTLFDTYEERLTPDGIIEAIQKWVNISSHRIAFMCVEIDPATCHRNRIAKALEDGGIAKTFDL